MPTKKEEFNLDDLKEMRRLMRAFRDSIQNYLDNIDMDEAEKKKEKE